GAVESQSSSSLTHSEDFTSDEDGLLMDDVGCGDVGSGGEEGEAEGLSSARPPSAESEAEGSPMDVEANAGEDGFPAMAATAVEAEAPTAAAGQGRRWPVLASADGETVVAPLAEGAVGPLEWGQSGNIAAAAVAAAVGQAEGAGRGHQRLTAVCSKPPSAADGASVGAATSTAAPDAAPPAARRSASVKRPAPPASEDDDPE
ncbi:unnamed protein product, partial [Phaeothamnion confervicola]